MDAESCDVGGERWLTGAIGLDVTGSGWFPSTVGSGTLSVRDGDVVIESTLDAPLEACLDAAIALAEAELGTEIAADDRVPFATMELLVDTHVGEVGAEVRLYEDDLRYLLPDCGEDEQCRDQLVQVDLAGTSHPL